MRETGQLKRRRQRYACPDWWLEGVLPWWIFANLENEKPPKDRKLKLSSFPAEGMAGIIMK